jgi:hypothetical protein
VARRKDHRHKPTATTVMNREVGGLGRRRTTAPSLSQLIMLICYCLYTCFALIENKAGVGRYRIDYHGR